jgi:hypothetical protein
MTTKQTFFLGILGLSGLLSNGQNVQSNALATSGGLDAATTISGLGGNTFYGNQAGFGSGNNVNNTFIGAYSGTDRGGDNNVFVGFATGQDGAGGGSENVYIGSYSGNDTSGNKNTYIGRNSGGGGLGNRNIMIGYNVGNDSRDKNDKLYIANTNTINPLIWGDFAQNQLKFNGKVGVGYGFGNYPTTAGSINVANYNMFVKGGILTEEVRVSLNTTWADYVFNKDYKLPSLQEVEKQIQEKGHLFNVPSAKQVAADGIELGEMAKIQQEKIEELTLYIIQQNKTNLQQSQEIAELKAMVKTLIEKNK